MKLPTATRLLLAAGVSVLSAYAMGCVTPVYGGGYAYPYGSYSYGYYRGYPSGYYRYHRYPRPGTYYRVVPYGYYRGDNHGHDGDHRDRDRYRDRDRDRGSRLDWRHQRPPEDSKRGQKKERQQRHREPAGEREQPRSPSPWGPRHDGRH